MKRGARGNIQVPALALALALLGVACKKDDCLKALDHFGHVTYLEWRQAIDQAGPDMQEQARSIVKACTASG